MNNWNPFFALANTRKEIDQAFENKSKLNKPIVFDDYLNDLQDLIVLSHVNQSVIIVRYYMNNKILSEEGFVSKINKFENNIKINDKIIKLESIIEIF